MTTALDDSLEPVSVTPPGSADPVYLRFPTFAEWHALAKAHRKLQAEGEDPSAELIAKTIATCLADDKGKPLGESAASKVLKASPRRVMWLYRTCWETVLKSDDGTVQELEKNSGASRD